jgi:hypothetical protein
MSYQDDLVIYNELPPGFKVVGSSAPAQAAPAQRTQPNASGIYNELPPGFTIVNGPKEAAPTAGLLSDVLKSGGGGIAHGAMNLAAPAAMSVRDRPTS